MTQVQADDLEIQISEWRAYLTRRQAIHGTDVAELEGHLREQVADLSRAGLGEDEAFLIAVKRMGNLDALSREFAREHSDRLWKQLVLPAGAKKSTDGATRTEVLMIIALALAAALASRIPELFGVHLLSDGGPFYFRNASLFALPFLAAYFVWKRQWPSGLVSLAAAFVIMAGFVNFYPFLPEGSTVVLAAMHLPLVLWLVVGFAYAGGQWRVAGRRMDFIRFSGELFIYYVLMALGGGVLIAVTLLMFQFIGLDVEAFATGWLLPCGAAGAVIVGAWLVEAKQSVIENMAPVLTRIFTPLFALMLLAFLVAMIVTAAGIDVEREVLIGFDLLLVLVLGLLLYAVSARDPQAPPNLFDVLQLILVVSALLVDVLALLAIVSRISEFGFSANRTAALGMNVILLVNLGWSAWLYVRFLRRGASFSALERWQTDYLPVYAIWAAIVVIAFPLLFGYA